MKSSKATGTSLCDVELLTREEAAAVLFGRSSIPQGKRFLERDAAAGRSVPFYKLPGSRFVRYKLDELTQLRDGSRIDAESDR